MTDTYDYDYLVIGAGRSVNPSRPGHDLYPRE